MIVIPSHSADVSEASLQRLILGRLAIMPGVAVLLPDGHQVGAPDPHALFWRQNVVADKAGPDRFVRAGVPGQPDIGGVVLGRAWGIETKRPRGGMLSKRQRAFHDVFRLAGGRCYSARTLADALVPVCLALGLDFTVAGATR